MTLDSSIMGKVARGLIVANAAVFALQLYYGDALLVHFALWPVGRYFLPEFGTTGGFEFWQLLTSSFLHASLPHISLNMLALYMFGRDVEYTLGARRFLALYFAAVLTAALVQLGVVTWRAGPVPNPTVGASGGVFGVLLAFGMLYPRRVVRLLIPPIPIRAWLLVTLYGLIELVSGVFGTLDGVAHFAHLGGMLGAWLLLRHWLRTAQRVEDADGAGRR